MFPNRYLLVRPVNIFYKCQQRIWFFLVRVSNNFTIITLPAYPYKIFPIYKSEMSISITSLVPMLILYYLSIWLWHSSNAERKSSFLLSKFIPSDLFTPILLTQSRRKLCKQYNFVCELNLKLSQTFYSAWCTEEGITRICSELELFW